MFRKDVSAPSPPSRTCSSLGGFNHALPREKRGAWKKKHENENDVEHKGEKSEGRCVEDYEVDSDDEISSDADSWSDEGQLPGGELLLWI